MARNTQAASPQQQILLKVMPAFFGLISLNIPAGVNVYFLASALFRIAQTGAMYRFDPTLKAHARKHIDEIEAKSVEVKRKPTPKPKPGKATGGGGGGGAKKDSGARPPQGKSNGGRRPPSRSPQKRRSKKGR